MSKSYRRTLIVFGVHTVSFFIWTWTYGANYWEMSKSESQIDMWGDVWMSILISFSLYTVAWVFALIFLITKRYITSVRISVFAIALMVFPFLFVTLSNWLAG